MPAMCHPWGLSGLWGQAGHPGWIGWQSNAAKVTVFGL
jgi:hypothetical protein